jgi:EAL domain-containing protein (putative c-di-GMP-specific phosphodiesterase class I)
VHDLVENERSRAVLSGIVGLAAGLGLHTIAEGVENAPTLVLLRELGVDLAQGFHLGRPSPFATRPPGLRALSTASPMTQRSSATATAGYVNLPSAAQ